MNKKQTTPSIMNKEFNFYIGIKHKVKIDSREKQQYKKYKDRFLII
jgi:hypothetical protein